MKTTSRSPFIVLMFLCLAAVGPKALAVSPPPDGGYPGGNTAEGHLALGSLTTGIYNNAVGIFSLLSLTTGSFNTANGAGTLLINTADENTATGAGALLSNSTGEGNTANGTFALFNNTTASSNTATGSQALLSNTTGNRNTANGFAALALNTSGEDNTAVGYRALSENNTTGIRNTATGSQALLNNTTGSGNTANGSFALFSNSTGSENTGLGRGAGSSITGNGNVCIGQFVSGEAGVDDTTWVRNVNTLAQPIVAGIDGVTVRLSDGRLGHGVSSRRYKEDIRPMDRASEALYGLKPVTFHYTKEIDPTQTLDFGLIAEEVAEVNPELAVRDRKGKISNYRRDAINAMLLNEFLKGHRKVEAQQSKIESQEATIAQLKSAVAQQQKVTEILTAQLKEQAAQIQKVSNQIDFTADCTQIVSTP